MAQCEIIQECKEHFDKIDHRLDSADEDFCQQRRDIAVLQTKLENVTVSLNNVTKALWGVAGAIGLSLLGFVIWFIQNK